LLVIWVALFVFIRRSINGGLILIITTFALIVLLSLLQIALGDTFEPIVDPLHIFHVLLVGLLVFCVFIPALQL